MNRKKVIIIFIIFAIISILSIAIPTIIKTEFKNETEAVHTNSSGISANLPEKADEEDQTKQEVPTENEKEITNDSAEENGTSQEEETQSDASSKKDDSTDENKVSESPSESSQSTKSESKSDSASKTQSTVKNTTVTESIPFETIKQNDSSLAKGQTKVVQEGKNGVKSVTYKETYENSKLASKEVVSSNVTQQPINKIIKVGTKEASENVEYTYTYEIIHFEVIEKYDNTLAKGRYVVDQEGRIGKQKTTYKVTDVEGEQLPRYDLVSKDVVVQNPINKIVRVGTKEVDPSTVFLPASDARNILNSSGLFRQEGNGDVYNYYTFNDSYEVQVVMGSNHVDKVYFDGLNYNAWKNTTKEELIEALGPSEAEAEWQFAQKETKRIEAAVRAAANAVYGSGTDADSLYREMMNEGTNRYFIREF